ncbi:MAG: CorA family divalent cation transporter [Bacteroidales bacterium]|jgi:magnesium transporter|nr:CorA family divalent cation transporter [Bacteroidales bacterium]
MFRQPGKADVHPVAPELDSDSLFIWHHFHQPTEEELKNLPEEYELHLAMANNQMAQAADNTNKTIRRLTFITTVFMPMTLFAGIGGMSEYTAVTGSGNWRLAYGLLMLFFLIMGILSYRWLKGIDKKS